MKKPLSLLLALTMLLGMLPASVLAGDEAEEIIEEIVEETIEEPAATAQAGLFPAEEPAGGAAGMPEEDDEPFAGDVAAVMGGSCGDDLTWKLDPSGVLTISGTGRMLDYPVENPGWFKFKTDLTSAVIKDGVTSIGESAFFQCTALTSVVIPGSVTDIGAYAFQHCTGLKTIRFEGADMPAIDTDAFKECGSLTAYYPSDGKNWSSGTYGATSIDWVEYYSGTCGALGDNLVWILAGDTLYISGTGDMADYDAFGPYPGWNDYKEGIRAVVVETGVTGIGGRAFFEFEALTSVEMPAGVTRLGDSAFGYCTSLTSINIPETVTNVGKSVFGYCEALTSVEIPAGMTSVGAAMFTHCTSLASVRLPQGVTAIGEKAFGYCTALASINLPAGVVSIGDEAFDRCASLTSIDIPEGVASIGSSAFCSCTSLASVRLPQNLKTIDWNAFSSCALTSIVIPEGVTSIEDYAFNYCTSLTTLELPAGLTTIGDYAFGHCKSLLSVNLPAGLTTIGENAFFECEKLTTLVIPERVTTIGEFAFDRTGIKVVRFECVKAPEIGRYAFQVLGATAYYPDTWSKVPVLYNDDVERWIAYDPAAPAFSIGQDYLAMEKGGFEQLDAVCSTPLLASKVTWGTTDDTVITVDGTGRVTAGGAGTAYATASMRMNGVEYTARCRVDVMEDGKTVSDVMLSASLTEPKATVELFRTDYTRFSVVLNLPQNMSVAGEELPDTGHAVTSARFDNENAAKYFDLRVVDDRTLEIVPNAAALEDGRNAPKQIAGSYKSNVLVTVDGDEKDAGLLTLTVKKSKPSIKIKAEKLNSYVEYLTAQLTVPAGVTFTCRKTPEWLKMDTWVDGRIRLASSVYAGQSLSGKLELECEVDGWAGSWPVTVSVSAAPVAPKLTFKPATVSLAPGVTDDKVTTACTLTPAASSYTGSSFRSYSIKFVKVTEGTDVYENGKVLKCELIGNNITVSNLLNDGLAHTYKVFYRIEDREYSFTVKVLAPKNVPGMTLKASGAVDLGIPKSSAVIKYTPKNYSYDYWVRVENIRAVKKATKTAPAEDFPVTDLFYQDWDKDNKKVVLTAKDPDALATGYTYYVDLVNDIDAAEPVRASVAFTVKKTVPKISLGVKAKGGIDVLRPATAVTLTPSWKNYYGYKAEAEQLSISYKVKGKGDPIACDEWFDVAVQDGAFVIKVNGKGRKSIDTTDKFTVTFAYEIGGTAYTKSLAFSVRQGAVSKAKAAPAAVAILKKDRYSAAAFSVSTNDPTLTDIDIEKTLAASVVPDALELRWEDGRFVVGWKDDRFPVKDGIPVKIPASYSVKVNLYLVGNNTAKANKALTVKVNTK